MSYRARILKIHVKVSLLVWVNVETAPRNQIEIKLRSSLKRFWSRLRLGVQYICAIGRALTLLVVDGFDRLDVLEFLEVILLKDMRSLFRGAVFRRVGLPG